MAVLRINNNFGDTFGSLGNALGNMWNPKLRAEAYELQQRMWLQQIQAQQELNKIRAQGGAITSYGGLPPDQLAVVTNMIRSGASQNDIDAYVASHATPGTTAQNIQNATIMTHHPWDQPYAPVVDSSTLAARSASDAMRAYNEELARRKAMQDVGGIEVAPGSQRIFPGGGLPASGPPSFTNPFYGGVLPPSVNAPAQGPAGPSGPAVAQPQANPAPANSASGAAPPVSTGPVSAPTLSGAGNVSGFTVTPPLVRQEGGSTILGASPSTVEASKTFTSENQKDLTEALDEGVGAQKLQNKINQIRALMPLAKTGGTWGQLTAAAQSMLTPLGFGQQTTPQQAQAAIDNMLSTEIPELRKEAGITRLAGPEIQSLKPQIGSATMAPEVLNNILANEAALADLQVKRRTNAQNVLFGQGDMGGFVKGDNALYANLPVMTDALRKSYGAVGTQTQFPTATAGPGAPPGAPPTNPSGMSGAVSGASPGPSGAVAAPAAPPGPAPTPQGPVIYDRLPDGTFVPRGQ